LPSQHIQEWQSIRPSSHGRGERPFAGLAEIPFIANPAAMSGTDQSGHIIYLGRVDFRNDRRMFGILSEDRFSHLYVLGKTGTGKSTLLENMAVQDLEHGNGFALIDPHGELADRIASRIPKSRQSDMVYLDASDPTQPYGYNPLRHVRADRIALAASGFLEVFKKMWPDAWGVRMEHILRNILMALLERQGSTMHDIVRVITDQKFRTELGRSVRNESVKRFFEKEYGGFSFGYRSDGTAPIQNKVGAFLTDPGLNRIVTGSKQELRVRQIMDEGRVLLVNLAKGQIGEDSSSLLGGLLVTTIGLAAFSRAEVSPKQRRDFFVYVDEFQSFTTLAVANMLSELRKYRVGFSIAHQYLHQLEPDIRHAVLGNVGTIISFRIGAEDSPYMVREFADYVEEIDLLQLPNHRVYLKLMIEGSPSKPFSAATVAPQ
jgi:type IV secretory pathway TraG/TraD family ATPase VirD4